MGPLTHYLAARVVTAQRAGRLRRRDTGCEVLPR